MGNVKFLNQGEKSSAARALATEFALSLHAADLPDFIQEYMRAFGGLPTILDELARCFKAPDTSIKNKIECVKPLFGAIQELARIDRRAMAKALNGLSDDELIEQHERLMEKIVSRLQIAQSKKRAAEAKQKTLLIGGGDAPEPEE